MLGHWRSVTWLRRIRSTGKRIRGKAGGRSAVGRVLQRADTRAARTVARVPEDEPHRGPNRDAEYPRQESNLHPALRRRVLYPLSYEGVTDRRLAPGRGQATANIGRPLTMDDTAMVRM